MMKKQNVRTLALIVATFTYLLVGAAIFDALESNNEYEEKERLFSEESEIQMRYNISDDDMETLRRNIIKSRPYRAGIQWKFTGSFYFCLSVIATIGYGFSTPRTPGGKVFCILYALIGIPLNIVMFQSIGERFNIGITIVLKRFKKCLNFKQINGTQTELTILACFLCSFVLLGGAAAFHHFESWDFLDAFYFCFITMSTIGFGDFVALQNSTMMALQTRPEYVAFSILYILFGLTVFAAALNLMVLRLLTMNTEDERKDELEAIAAAKTAVKIDGDVITSGPNNQGIDKDEGLYIEMTDSSLSYTEKTDSNKNIDLKTAHTNGYLSNNRLVSSSMGLSNSCYKSNGSKPAITQDFHSHSVLGKTEEEEEGDTEELSIEESQGLFTNTALNKRCSV